MRSDILVAVERIQKQNAPSFAPIYIGYPGTTFIAYKVTKELTVLDLQTSVAFEELIERVPDFGLHFAVRTGTAPDDIYEPFLKGTRQRHVAPTSLIEWDAHDAIECLGDDYPYLLDKGKLRQTAATVKRFAKVMSGRAKILVARIGDLGWNVLQMLSADHHPPMSRKNFTRHRASLTKPV